MVGSVRYSYCIQYNFTIVQQQQKIVGLTTCRNIRIIVDVSIIFSDQSRAYG